MTRQLVSQAEFARLLGVDKARVTRLKQAERLVMVDGKVDVEASRARIAETSDPAHSDKKPANHNAAYNEARARKEMAQAEQAEMESAKMRGSLVDAEEVRLFAADIGATFRGALESLPDRLAAELVALKEVEEIRAVLVDNFEQLLADVSLKIEKGIE